MKKSFGLAAVAILLVLTGCGGGNDNSSSDTTTTPTTDTTSQTTAPTETTESSETPIAGGPYCDALEHARSNLSSINLAQLDEDSYATLQTELANVKSAAPADVQDDWGVLSDTLTELHKTLADAGISFDDLSALSSGQVPPGISQQKLQKLGPKVQKITSGQSLQKASDAIQQSAQKECGLTFGN